MKHLKLFESNIDNIYVVKVINGSKEEMFAFIDIESRDNFLINYIHKNYSVGFDDNEYKYIKDIFSVDELLSEYNTDHSYIELDNIELQKNVKLDPKLQLRKDKLEYNL